MSMRRVTQSAKPDLIALMVIWARSAVDMAKVYPHPPIPPGRTLAESVRLRQSRCSSDSPCVPFVVLAE